MSLDFLENDYENSSRKYSTLNFESGNTNLSSEDIRSKESDDEQPTFINNVSGPPKKNKPSNKLLKTVKKNKVVALVGGGLGGGILVLIIIVFILGQQLPGFAALLADANMARSNRAFERDSTELTSEETALSEESTANQAALETTYSDANTGNFLSKLNNLRPSVALDNLEGSGALEYNYGPVSSGIGKLVGAKEIKSITIHTPAGDQTFLADDLAPSKWDLISHPLQTLGNRATAVSGLSDALGTVDETGSVLVRYGELSQIISGLGGSPLAGILSSKFVNDDQQDASVELDEQAESAINPTGDVSEPLTQGLSEAVNDGENIQAADLNGTNAADVQKAQLAILENGGVDPAVDTAVTNDVAKEVSQSEGALGFLDIAYLVGIPACIIYDGSLQSPNAGQTINKQDAGNRKIVFISRKHFWARKKRRFKRRRNRCNQQ